MSTPSPPASPPPAPARKSRGKSIVGGLALAFVLFVGGVLAAASLKPAVFRVQRSILVNAPPERIAPHINDLKTWGQWSPWEKIDPDMHREYAGADSGVGARYAWEGDANIGAGRIEIIESTREKIAMNLDFLRPMESHNVAEFLMTPEGNGTKLTWAMQGDNTFVGKIVQVFFSMDEMVGKPFDEGLRNLKRLAEEPAASK